MQTMNRLDGLLQKAVETITMNLLPEWKAHCKYRIFEKSHDRKSSGWWRACLVDGPKQVMRTYSSSDKHSMAKDCFAAFVNKACGVHLPIGQKDLDHANTLERLIEEVSVFAQFGKPREVPAQKEDSIANEFPSVPDPTPSSSPFFPTEDEAKKYLESLLQPSPVPDQGQEEEVPAVPVETRTAEVSAKPAKQDITDLIKVSGKHEKCSLIKTILRLRRYPLMWGSPGSGKTHLFTSIMQEMELPSSIVTLSQDSMRSEQLGSKSPLNGEYFTTDFRKIWEHGGGMLFDEIGLANANLVNIFNAALEQRVINFPDGKTVKMHENCFVLFADNSNLRGCDPLFPERQDLGGAFRDRLSYIQFGYDESLELDILKKIWNDPAKARAWHNAVLQVRQIINKAQIPIFASPRFAFRGSELLQNGLDFRTICEIELWKGLDEDTISSVRSQVYSCWR
jgi:MoxR-like ATPase